MASVLALLRAQPPDPLQEEVQRSVTMAQLGGSHEFEVQCEGEPALISWGANRIQVQGPTLEAGGERLAKLLMTYLPEYAEHPWLTLGPGQELRMASDWFPTDWVNRFRSNMTQFDGLALCKAHDPYIMGHPESTSADGRRFLSSWAIQLDRGQTSIQIVGGPSFLLDWQRLWGGLRDGSVLRTVGPPGK